MNSEFEPKTIKQAYLDFQCDPKRMQDDPEDAFYAGALFMHKLTEGCTALSLQELTAQVATIEIELGLLTPPAPNRN